MTPPTFFGGTLSLYASVNTVHTENGSSLQTAVRLPSPVPLRLQGRSVAPSRVRDLHHLVGLLRVCLRHEHIWLATHDTNRHIYLLIIDRFGLGTFPKGPNTVVSVLVSGEYVGR